MKKNWKHEKKTQTTTNEEQKLETMKKGNNDKLKT